MRPMRVGEFEIVPFAGFFKIKDTRSGDRVGTIYAHYEDAYMECIELKRKELGIVVR